NAVHVKANSYAISRFHQRIGYPLGWKNIPAFGIIIKPLFVKRAKSAMYTTSKMDDYRPNVHTVTFTTVKQ
ncbi:hypothetical protein U1Q18_051145, partial [Sarracenia purpurea var. burkii]